MGVIWKLCGRVEVHWQFRVGFVWFMIWERQGMNIHK